MATGFSNAMPCTAPSNCTRPSSHSCDTFFYEAGNRIGIDNIAQYAQLSGFGKKTGIDLPSEAEGLMPTPRWKIRVQHDKWQVGETVNVSIGQGAVTVTPLQLASAIGGLAIGGVWYKPHLAKDWQAAEPRHADFNAANVAKVVSGMYGVVNEPGGTGTSGAIPGLTYAEKPEPLSGFPTSLPRPTRPCANR